MCPLGDSVEVQGIRDMNKQPQFCTFQQFSEGIQVRTGEFHVLKLDPLCFRVRLQIDPARLNSVDDRFTLTGRNKGGDEIDKHVKTTADDLIRGDGYVDLLYMPVWPNLRYSLEVDPGKEGSPYLLFDDVPGQEIGVPAFASQKH